MNSLTLKGGNIHHITGVNIAPAIVAVGTCGYANMREQEKDQED